ncbi:MAG: formate--tetrahydrofolate ligase [Erysipelotrichaceae bacterium]|nr:formate--tetrahydrofolate ligase [Erysipelotrichaceae bacterium]
MSEKEKEINEEEDAIDLISLIDELLKGMAHFWILILLTAVLLSSFFAWRSLRSFSPTYKVEANVSVATDIGDGSDQSQSTANLLGKVFPYILTSGLLSDIVAEDLGRASVPGKISVTNVPNTPLLTISVTSSSQSDASAILESVINNYPKVAQYVVGSTTLNMIGERKSSVAVSRRSVVIRAVRNGTILSLAMGVILGLFYALTYKTIKTPKDIRSVVNTSYLGTLPVYRKKKRKNSSSAGINILETNVQQSYLEALRQIRTKLERRLNKHHAKVLMVTSSIPGEGKSTVSANLAISMAMNNKNVLLIDADLRNPSLKEVLNVKGSYPGIASVLNGKSSFSQAVSSYENQGIKLHLMFGSDTPTKQIEVLGSPVMKQFLDHVKNRYDLIILDTPPSAMLADAMMLANYVDATLYVIMYDYARRQYVIDGITELTGANVYVAGCVINAGKDEASGYGYGYGKGSYYYGKSKTKTTA